MCLFRSIKLLDEVQTICEPVKLPVETGAVNVDIHKETDTGNRTEVDIKETCNRTGVDMPDVVQTGSVGGNTVERKDCGFRCHTLKSSVQKLAEACETWMSCPNQWTSDCLSIPPIHDVSPSLVQRSLFISQLRRNATSLCASLGMHKALEDIVSLASSFK